MSDEKYMVKQTITFSDGTETVLEYKKNDDADMIEETVAKAVAGDHKVSRDAIPEEMTELEISEEPVIPEVEISEEVEEVKAHKGKKK